MASEQIRSTAFFGVWLLLGVLAAFFRAYLAHYSLSQWLPVSDAIGAIAAIAFYWGCVAFSLSKGRTMVLPHYRDKAFIGIAIGVFVHLLSTICQDYSMHGSLLPLFVDVLKCIALGFLLWGSCCYAISKGRSCYWGLLGWVWILVGSFFFIDLPPKDEYEKAAFAARGKEGERAAISTIVILVIGLIIMQITKSNSQDPEQQALDNQKKQASIKTQLDNALHLVQSGKFDPGMTIINKMVNDNPSMPVVYIYRGEARYSETQYVDSINDFNQAIAVDPKSDQAYADLGKAYYQLGQYQQAVDNCSKAINFNPTSNAAYTCRADAYAKLGKTDLAKQDREQVKTNDGTATHK